jgi:hypothetical protein
VRPPSSKFSALKRKLFPSTQRRAPLRVPALLPLSPISTNTEVILPPDQVEPQQADSQYGGIDRKVDGNDEEEEGNNDLHEDRPVEHWSSDAVEKLGEMAARCEGVESARPDYDSDEDDRDLELAVEALDYESSNAEETLAEVGPSLYQASLLQMVANNSACESR